MKTVKEIFEARENYDKENMADIEKDADALVEEITEGLFLCTTKEGITKYVGKISLVDFTYGDLLSEKVMWRLRGMGFEVHVSQVRDPWGRPEFYIETELPQVVDEPPRQFPSLWWKVIGLTIVGLIPLALLVMLGCGII